MTNVIDDMAVPTDEAVADHNCPVHDDLSFDYESLNVYERRTLEIICGEITVAEDTIRRAQAGLDAGEGDERKRSGWRSQIVRAGRYADTARRNAARILSTETVLDGPIVDLWG